MLIMLLFKNGIWGVDVEQLVELDGIVFIDEIDKIVINYEIRYGVDVSFEGVQCDLLLIIEGR